MAKIVAFEVEIDGIKETFRNLDEVRDRAKALKALFEKSDFGSDKFVSLQKALAQLSKVQEETRRSTARMKYDIDASNKDLGESYRQLNARLVALRNSYKDLSEAERDGKVGRAILQDITLLDTKLKKIDAGMGLFQRNVGDYLGAINRFAAQAGNALGGAAGGIVSGIGNVAGAGALGAPAALLALGSAATGAVQGIVQLEAKVSDLKAAIQKTAGLSADEVTRLAEELKTLDTRSSIGDLLDIGKVLGQFGVTVNKDTISAIDKLNVALSDEFGNNAELVTSVVGKLRNVFTEFKTDKPDEAFLKIGNALNELGASGAATAPVVADFASRLGGTLGQFGISAGDIFGVSAALEELGTTAERGASGLSRVFLKLSQSPEKFVKALQLSDETVKELTDNTFRNFSEVVNKDIFQAFELVLGQINRLNLSNTQTTALFKELKLNEQGSIEVLSKLAGAQDLLTSRTNIANQAIKSSAGITKEFTTVNNTLAGELSKLKNSMENAFLNTGIAVGITSLLNWLNETQRASVSTAAAIEQEKIQLQSMIYVATDVNTTQERRAELIAEMQAKYPEYFKNLTTEQITNLKLVEILGQVNQKYNEKIAFLALGDRASNAEKAKNDAIQKQLGLELELRTAILKAQAGLSKYGFVQSNDIRRDIQEIQKIFEGENNVYGFNSLANAIRKYEGAVKSSGEATRENFKIQIQSFQEFDRLIKTNKDYNETILGQVAAFGELAKIRRKEADELERAGKRQEAKTKLTNIELDARQLLNKVDVEQLKILKEQADRVKHLRASQVIGGALSGIESIQQATSVQKSTSTTSVVSGKAAKSAVDNAENEVKQYYEQKIKALEKYQSIYQDKEIQLIQSERERAIEQEKKKASDQIAQIDDTNRKLIEKQKEAIDKLNKSISKADGNERAKLVRRRTEFELQFQNDNIKLTSESEKAKQSIIEASNATIEKINETYDARERERIKRQQQSNLQGITQYFKKIEEGISLNRRKFDLGLLQDRNAELSKAGGDAELIKKINLKYDTKGLEQTEVDILMQIKNTDNKIAAARSLNSVQTLLGLPPAFAQEALEQFGKEQDNLTLTLKEAEEKRKAITQNNIDETSRKRTEDSKRRIEEAKNEVFEIAKELSNFFNSGEKQRLETERDQRLSILEAEYERKIELARGNANEEARIQAELAKKKTEIDRKYQEEQRKIAKKQAIIAGALSLLQLFASPSPDYLTKLILAGGLLVTTGIQVAAIDQQKFEKGGTFKGKSHHYGGVQGVFSDGTRVEVEKDEDFFIINKRNSYLRKRLSGINSYKGAGRRFAEGGSVFGNENLFRPSEGGRAIVVSAEISDVQMAQLAHMVAMATMEGTYQGAQQGIAAGDRINERYNELRKRTNR